MSDKKKDFKTVNRKPFDTPIAGRESLGAPLDQVLERRKAYLDKFRSGK